MLKVETPELITNEEIQGSWVANHLVTMDSTGGKLFVTNQRLIFNSHQLNFQAHQWSIDLNNIKEIKLSNTIGIIPNGLLVIDQQGKKDRFITWKRKSIRNAVLKQIS